MEGPSRRGQPGCNGHKGRKPSQPPYSAKHAGAERRRAPEAPERITVRILTDWCGTPRRLADPWTRTRDPGRGELAQVSGPGPSVNGSGAEASALATARGASQTPEGASFARSSSCAPRTTIWHADPVGAPDHRGQRTSCSSELEVSLHDETPGCQAWRHARPVKQGEARTPGAAVDLRAHKSAREQPVEGV
jgi:hypothetical protein